VSWDPDSLFVRLVWEVLKRLMYFIGRLSRCFDFITLSGMVILCADRKSVTIVRVHKKLYDMD
jgi:hypothetical protein